MCNKQDINFLKYKTTINTFQRVYKRINKCLSQITVNEYFVRMK